MLCPPLLSPHLHRKPAHPGVLENATSKPQTPSPGPQAFYILCCSVLYSTLLYATLLYYPSQCHLLEIRSGPPAPRVAIPRAICLAMQVSPPGPCLDCTWTFQYSSFLGLLCWLVRTSILEPKQELHWKLQVGRQDAETLARPHRLPKTLLCLCGFSKKTLYYCQALVKVNATLADVCLPLICPAVSACGHANLGRSFGSAPPLLGVQIISSLPTTVVVRAEGFFASNPICGLRRHAAYSLRELRSSW